MPSNCQQSGTVDFKVGEETYQTWFKVFGSLKNGKTPLIALHGGLGMTHHYMLPHEALFEKAGYGRLHRVHYPYLRLELTVTSIPVILYDQLGNGGSSHIKDKPAEFWTVELFMDELDNLLEHLGVVDNFDLLGHSWGGMLAAQYAASRAPKGLRKLIIANSLASAQLFFAGANDLLERFPPEQVAIVRKCEEEGDLESPEYTAVLHRFHVKHICSTLPWPRNLMDSFHAMANNPTVNHALFGHLNFIVTGNLKEWSIIDILPNVHNPTLLISAPMDEVQEPAFIPFFLHIPRVKWVEIPTSTHLAMYEDPERYFGVILKFLT